MSKSSTLYCCLFLLLIPALAWSGPLDDYYLQRFAPKVKSTQMTTSGATSAVSERAERCRTPLLKNLRRDWNLLLPTTQTVLAKQLASPALASPATYNSPAGHFAIHYATYGTDAPDLADDDYDGTPDWVETVAAVFEHVYQVEVSEMGYRQPPGTRYDIYLRDLASEGVYGYTNTVSFVNSTSVSSYIEIDRAFTSPVYGGYPALESLRVTAAHEYHHAIEFGYNYYCEIWYAEVTATWMEDEVYDYINQLYEYLPAYLSHTTTVSLDGALGNNSEYGRWIFNRSIAERQSPSLIKQIWERLGSMAAPSDHSDIPTLPVINSMLSSAGSSLAAEFSALAKKVYSRQWTSHVNDVSQITYMAPVTTFITYPVTSSAVAASAVALPHYTFAYYKFMPTSTAPANLTLAFSNVQSGLEVTAFKKGIDGTITSYPMNTLTKTLTVPSFNSSQTLEVQLLVANSGASDTTKIGFTSDVSGLVPGVPTSVTATGGNAKATVYFLPPASSGGSAVTSYKVTSSPGNVSVTGSASPITVPGLVNGTPYTFTVTASNAYGAGSASAASNSVTPAVPYHTVTLSFAGTGGGSVNGSKSCTTGSNCPPVQVLENTLFTVTASPDGDSLFGGWSGACVGAGNTCQFTVSTDKAATAQFDAVSPVRIQGGAGYSLFSGAYAAATSGSVIQGREKTLLEALILARPVSVFIEGGYDTAFGSRNGVSVIDGSLKVRNGTVRVKGLAVR